MEHVDERERDHDRAKNISSSLPTDPSEVYLDDDNTPNKVVSPDMIPSPSSSPRSTRSSGSDRTSSPPTLPPVMHLKRPNPKRLALSLSLPPSSDSPTTASTVCPSPDTVNTETTTTPFTPGPPKTPALAMSVGRATTKSFRRASLLSLITQPSTAAPGDVPPTPGVSSHPYATIRQPRRPRARSNTAEEPQPPPPRDPRASRSAYPGLGGYFNAISEDNADDNSLAALAYALPSTSSTSTSFSSSASASTSSAPSSPPPLTRRPAEPYEDGPIELLPGIFLGAEQSVFHYDSWTRGRRVRVLNVAQEIDDPFAPHPEPSQGKGKAKVRLANYPAEGDRPEMAYTHLRWSHGEQGLAEVDREARLDEILLPANVDRDQWRFWEAIRWIERGRRAQEPVLIHCQCGVSRSATLAIAYVMALAASGALPSHLGHIRGMQDAYDFVKSKSPWIGPNVSLVFQLVEFARNLTTLITIHLETPGGAELRGKTSFPTAAEAAVSEDEWARKRRAFDELSEEDEGDGQGGLTPELMSPEEAEGEARALDEAMKRRAMGRV
ncbi:hypothetical protein JCM24511_06748 [Saitozyma sp. JCM 24511]|nr:hypothetical protein JCM24511_06748 [Saitozyma sp. JCM 24511]